MFLFNVVQANTVQQRTQFATSNFRRQIIDALDFRNRFAQCPFLCRELIEPENIQVSCCHYCSGDIHLPFLLKTYFCTLLC